MGSKIVLCPFIWIAHVCFEKQNSDFLCLCGAQTLACGNNRKYLIIFTTIIMLTFVNEDLRDLMMTSKTHMGGGKFSWQLQEEVCYLEGALLLQFVSGGDNSLSKYICSRSPIEHYRERKFSKISGCSCY